MSDATKLPIYYILYATCVNFNCQTDISVNIWL